MTAKTVSNQKINLLESAEQFVQDLLCNHSSNKLYFHDFKHTLQLKKAAIELANEAGIDDNEKKILILAILFQNTGYSEKTNKYWIKSKDIAADYLENNDFSQDKIIKVKELINLLDPNSNPDSLLQKLFIDAHYSYFGKKSFIKRLRRLRKEKEALTGNKENQIEWQKKQIKRLSSHVFCTRFGEDMFGKRKLKNISKLKDGHKKSLKIKSEREKRTSVSANSGARTLFKTALRNHIDLTAIADQKANIMLSINALIITIGLPAFSTYLSDTSYLIIPAVIFLFTSAATMVLATLSTRPIKMNGETDLSKLMTGKTNLFFFGNFYKLRQDEYQGAIKKIVSDRKHLDTSFINDLFYLGHSLGDKYRLLRLCYTVFVIGVCLSVLAFIVAYIISTSS